MEILKYQKIKAEFKPWSPVYLEVAEHLANLIQTDQIEVLHFGSTSAKIGGKGIIDLSILYPTGFLDVAVQRLVELGFQDENSDNPFPPERPRKDGSVLYKGSRYQIHAHVIEKGSQTHQEQIAYKEFMLANPQARADYEASKKHILEQGVTDQASYGELKSPFVKGVLQQFR